MVLKSMLLGDLPKGVSACLAADGIGGLQELGMESKGLKLLACLVGLLAVMTTSGMVIGVLGTHLGRLVCSEACSGDDRSGALGASEAF